MNCKKIRPFLPLLAAHELEEPQTHEVKEHVTHCTACRQALEGTSKVQALLALKRHEQADELFLRNYLSEFHGRLYHQVLEQNSFWNRLVADILFCRKPLVWFLRGAYLLTFFFLALSLYTIHSSVENNPQKRFSNQPADLSIAQNQIFPQHVAEVESRFSHFVLAKNDANKNSVYVLDRIQYEPSTDNAVLLRF